MQEMFDDVEVETAVDCEIDRLRYWTCPRLHSPS